MNYVPFLKASNGSGEPPRASVTIARSIAATTLTVDAVTNWPPYFVATSGVLNTETGVLNPATVKVFRGHIASGKIEIDAFAPGYTDAGNAVGDIVVLKPNTLWADLVADNMALLETQVGTSLNPDGTLTTAAMTQIAGNATVKAKRTIPRIRVQASTATLTPDIDSYNYERVTALTTAINVANPTGTPSDGEGLVVEITGTAARAITWGTSFEANSQYSLTLPSTTVTTKTTFVTFTWNSTRAKWLMMA
jgi:hypothetical protein